MATPAQRRRGWAAYTPAWLLFMLLAAATFAAKGVVIMDVLHDASVVWDAGWRTFSGEVPHLDFHSPVGLGYFWPWALLRHIEPYSVLTLLDADLIVGGALLALATLTLPRRLPPALFFLGTVAVLGVAITPRMVDRGPFAFSHLAPYNRWCQAAAMLVALIVLLAPQGRTERRPGRDPVAAVALGLLLAFLYYVKITYFLGAAGLVIVGLITAQIGLATVAGSVAAGALVAIAVELTEHNNAAYLADLAMASRATVEVHAGLHLLNRQIGIVLGLAYAVAIAAVVWLRALADGDAAAWLRRWWRLALLTLGALVGAAVMNTQNNYQHEIPLMGTVLLVAYEHVRRAAPPGRPWRTGAAAALLLVGAAFNPARDVVAVVAHAAVSRSAAVCSIPALRGTPGEAILLTPKEVFAYARATPASCAGLGAITPQDARTASLRLEVARITDGMHLLRGRQGPHDRVLALDFSNPYPAFTGTPSPADALLWWDLGRSYGPGEHPDAAAMLRRTRFVLQSRFDIPYDTPHGANAWAVYGGAVEQAYRPVAETSLWRLWERR